MSKTATLSKIGSENLVVLNNKSRKYQENSRAEATKAAYRSDWNIFLAWCNDNNFESLPSTPSTVRLYITHLADIGRAPSTIQRAMTSIRQAHQLSELPSPTINPEVTETWRGIKRELGTAQSRAKPIMLSDLKKILDAIRPTMIGRRDAAILSVGWAAALRRSEIVSLNRENIEFVPEGMVVTISRSKTDQTGEGYKIGIPFAQNERYCPTKRLKHWISLAKIESGALFFKIGMAGKKFHTDVLIRNHLSPRMINTLIRLSLERAGFDTIGYTGHSLRAGFVTTAASKKIPEYLIQLHTRHRTSKSLRGYIRESQLFSENSLSTIL